MSSVIFGESFDLIGSPENRHIDENVTASDGLGEEFAVKAASGQLACLKENSCPHISPP
jgi:hypothetical protein